MYGAMAAEDERLQRVRLDKEVAAFLSAHPTFAPLLEGVQESLHEVREKRGFGGVQKALQIIAKADLMGTDPKAHLVGSLKELANSARSDEKGEDAKESQYCDLGESLTSTASPALSEAGEMGDSSSASVSSFMEQRDEVSARATPPEVPVWAPPYAGSLQYLQDMLGYMDSYCQGMRSWQQQWVSLVETACRTVLDSDFKEMVLVGSLALSLETPGSDVDVVCMTHSPADQVDAVAVLRKVKEILTSDSHSSGFPEGFQAVVIDDARIPILAVSSENQVLVDLAINSHHSIQHVKWFHHIGAVPPNPPKVVQVPVLTVTLRCIKWWLRMRRIPRMKDGALPTVAWMLLAMHVSAEQSGCLAPDLLAENPFSAVLTLLSAFFQRYTTVSGLDGKLRFEKGSAVSVFQQHARPKRPCHADLVVIDPETGVNLAPPMSPATHILLVHELLRARSLLKDTLCSGQSHYLHAAFQPVPEFANSLPASSSGSFDALVFVNGNGESSCTVELVRIHSVHKTPWWQAPFLARWDMQSRLEAHLFCEQQAAGRCCFVQSQAITLAPWNFICRVETTGDEKVGLALDEEALHCLRSMQALASEMQSWAAVKSR
ncbi:unnamed protein product [Effrenium voratum]|uniref:Poly(A) RNA polymerase mitochondrial-like central palm domain-containing protein n=1 Tax=Effrenium voratum TaxID=2562239 RepID=A0AA36IZI9_9DINO|nr:unnamed protein product [Effrenium voratum]CAJ1446208.1 unnamed protein product [Effrenium voratum]